MTDNEIIKALVCCHTTVDETDCPNCPSYDTELGDCNGIPWKRIVDIINRQKEEIERLENDLAISQKETKRYITSYKAVKVEKMTQNDLLTIIRFLGAVEGVLLALPEGAQTLLLDYMEVVDSILAKEMAGGQK